MAESRIQKRSSALCFNRREGRRFNRGQTLVTGEVVAQEVPVALEYNGISHAVMMATPADLEAFALGFSITEGIIEAPDEILRLDILEDLSGLRLCMRIPDARAASLLSQIRALAGRSGCGVCGARDLESALRWPRPVAHTVQVSAEALQRAFDALPNWQPLNAATGAVHAAAWCAPDGTIQCAMEDVGRHNALDKLIGTLLSAQPSVLACNGGTVPITNGFVLMSSRASYELIQKTASVGIQLLAAVSGPTDLALKMADGAGVTLIGFVRDGRHTVYTHPGRVQASTASNMNISGNDYDERTASL